MGFLNLNSVIFFDIRVLGFEVLLDFDEKYK